LNLQPSGRAQHADVACQQLERPIQGARGETHTLSPNLDTLRCWASQQHPKSWFEEHKDWSRVELRIHDRFGPFLVPYAFRGLFLGLHNWS